MPQIRKDYLFDEYVIISTERGKRPNDFLGGKKPKKSDKKKCPFCPENVHMIPGVIEEIKEKNDWQTRAIWNKYKAASKDGDPIIRTDNEFYTYGDAVGEHEVIVETKKHGLEMEDLKEEHIANIIRLIVKRINENYEKGAKYVCVFKNKGSEAGASLSHAHHQIISYNIFPNNIKKDVDIIRLYKKTKGICPYCKIINSEKDSERRIFEDENFVAFSPYASRFPMEAWILPKRCIHSITELTDDEIISLAGLLKKILKKLSSLNYPPHNLLYKISSPNEKDYHFRIEITPRLSKWAGFEHTSGTIINTILPKEAAKFYKED